MRALVASLPVGSRIFAGLAAYFVVLDALYTVFAYGEWAGSVLLALGAALQTSRRRCAGSPASSR